MPAFTPWNICVRSVSVHNVPPEPHPSLKRKRRAILRSRFRLGWTIWRIPMQPPGGQPQKIALPNIQNVIAIASGKGGVGKSTVAANLALALAQTSPSVGLLDADIYGPSVPIMMGIHDVVDQRTTPFPLERYGLKL